MACSESPRTYWLVFWEVILLDSAEAIARTLAGWVCHQMPSRSMISGGLISWFCVRCLALYFGVLVGGFSGRAGLSNKRAGFAMICIAALAVEVVVARSTATSRFFSGYAGGFGIGSVLMGLVVSESRCSRASWPAAAEWALGAVFGAAMVHSKIVVFLIVAEVVALCGLGLLIALMMIVAARGVATLFAMAHSSHRH